MHAILAHALVILVMIMMPFVYFCVAYLHSGLHARMENSTSEIIQALHPTYAKVTGSLIMKAEGEVSRSLFLVNMIPRNVQHITVFVHTVP